MPSCQWWHGTFRQGTSILCCQGLENSWEQHRAVSTRLCQGLQDLGLELFVKEEVSEGSGHSPAQLRASLVLERDPQFGEADRRCGSNPLPFFPRQRGCPLSPPSKCLKATTGRRSQPS